MVVKDHLHSSSGVQEVMSSSITNLALLQASLSIFVQWSVRQYLNAWDTTFWTNDNGHK